MSTAGRLPHPTQTSYRIGLEQSPELDALTGLAAVAGAEQLHSDYYRISLKSGCQPSELAQQILAQGWGLIELKPERISLEQLFLEATTGGVS